MDIASCFGKDPFDYYLVEMKDFLNSFDRLRLSFLGLALITVFQMKGLLPSQLSNYVNNGT